jgi:alginate O-acetyltransferase complex protein AlgJ
VLHKLRRYWVLGVFSMLGLPLVIGILRPDGNALAASELRDLAPAPELPRGVLDWQELPGHIDAYLRDHFGLRKMLIHWEALLNQGVFRSGNQSVMYGRDGWMFYRNDDMVLQSAGIVRHDQRVVATADLLAAIRNELSASGIKLLVAPPPNSATIYPEQLPGWARNHGKRTEYDLLLNELVARGVSVVDLRPPLRDARLEGRVYNMHDTHWTNRGALAGYNAIVEADSHPDWRLAASSSLGASTDRKGGDLARMLGIPEDVSEPAEPLTLPPGGKYERLSPDHPEPEWAAPISVTSDRPGPSIMVIGDSFARDFFFPMLMQHARHVVFLHHRFCGFDWKWIIQFHPDEVWWMPTERYLVCAEKTRTHKFPPPGASAG